MSDDVLAALKRIEDKIDMLLFALAEDEEEQPEHTLDGELVPGERDQNQAL